MHQTFYIDVDEEISSVIDRLRKSMSVDNYFVAPKRAIFLQSIVNLKLLKREADKIGKHVILVTQEEVAVAMATRSGIDVQRTIDEPSAVLDVEMEDEDEVEEAPMEVAPSKTNSKSSRLNSVGSSSFYDNSSMDMRKKEVHVKRAGSSHPHHPQTAIGRYSQDKHLPKQVNGAIRKPHAAATVHTNMKHPAGLHEKAAYHLDRNKEKTLERMFSDQTKHNDSENKEISNGKTKNFFFIFVVICLILLGGVAGYLYIPSADVTVVPNVQTEKIDLDLEAGTGNVDAIPVHVISKKEEITEQFDATGKSSSLGKKSHGSVVIYNEFSDQPQTLVATTRIQSESGKIFRIVKTVTVPGSSQASGELKPGAITAEVIADEPGTEYNIDPSKFTIPGFQGSPKFDKFYVKSTSAMSGGTSDGDGSAGVSQSDLDNAKKNTEAALKEQVTQSIKDELADGEIDLPQAEKIVIEKSSAGSKVGDAVSTFKYTAVANVQVLAFSEKDVKNVIEKSGQFKGGNGNVSKEIRKIEYGSLQPDFDKNVLLLQVHSEIASVPNINQDSLMQELLGKDEDELAGVLKKHQEIKTVNVLFWPTFMTRIPQYSQRVNMHVEQQ